MANFWKKSCTSVIYSCKWNAHAQEHLETSTPCEKVFFVKVFLILLLGACWLYSWSVLDNDSNDINIFLLEYVPNFYHWFVVILVVSVVLTLYIFILFVVGLVQIASITPLRLFICHKILLWICAAFFIVAFILIAELWSDEFDSIKVSFDMTGPFLQLFAVVTLVLIVWYIAVVAHKLNIRKFKIAVFALYLSIFIFIFSVIFWLNSPCIATQSHDKPLLIGHRGAPTLAPENTILSYERALSCDTYGLETDVRISSDGIPFLMHDETLFRTTDVEEKFPMRKNDRAESFSWSELQQLNAGDWFLKLDPFLTNGALNKEDRNNISTQKIPSFHEFATFAARNNKSIIFDLARPPVNHTYYHNYVNLNVQTLLNSGIRQEQVLWLYTSDQDLVNTLAPGFRVVSHDVVVNASVFGIEIFNLIYSMTTERAISLNYPIISYIIDKNWAFSRAWCQGVWAVTTNQCSLLRNIERPSWSLTKAQYYGIWISIDIILLILMIIIIYFCSFKRRKENYEVVLHL